MLGTGLSGIIILIFWLLFPHKLDLLENSVGNGESGRSAWDTFIVMYKFRNSPVFRQYPNVFPYRHVVDKLAGSSIPMFDSNSWRYRYHMGCKSLHRLRVGCMCLGHFQGLKQVEKCMIFMSSMGVALQSKQSTTRHLPQRCGKSLQCVTENRLKSMASVL